MRRLVLSALVALTLIPALALAQAQGATEPMRAGTENLSGWLVLDPGGPAGIGLGARYMIPLVPEGLLSGQGLRVREELALEVGADFLHWSHDWRYYDTLVGWRDYHYSVNALEVVAGVMWNWWLTPRLALYPKLDLGYSFAWVSDWPGEQYGLHSPGYSDLFVNGAIGAIFKLRKVALRIEAGNHSLRLGVGVKL
jgi:hypothetical protein